MMNIATYASFIAIRDWTKNIPSASVSSATIAATLRRRNRIRVRTYSSAAIAAPARTPGSRHENACEPTSTDAVVPSAERASSCWRSLDWNSSLVSSAIAAGLYGNGASA
jgi:hypothetical protein